MKVIWDVEVRPGAHDGAVLSSTTRFVATDDPARANLLAAWGVVGTVSTMLAKRALATLRDAAEEHQEHSLGVLAPADLRQAA